MTFDLEAYRDWTCAQFEHDEQRLRQLYADSPAGVRFMQDFSVTRPHDWREAQVVGASDSQ